METGVKLIRSGIDLRLVGLRISEMCLCDIETHCAILGLEPSALRSSRKMGRGGLRVTRERAMAHKAVFPKGCGRCKGNDIGLQTPLPFGTSYGHGMFVAQNDYDH